MRLHEVIDTADRMRPNSVHFEDKVREVYRLEREMAEMMEEEVPVWDLATEDPLMLVGSPHDQVYALYLLPFIDLQQEETDLYQVDSIAANAALSEVKAMYRRGHEPVNHTMIKGVFI